MATADEMLAAIKDYVRRERVRQGISKVGRVAKSELSGEMFGEFAMLLDRQLITTEINCGSWVELKDIQVLESVYRLVKSRECKD